MHNEVLAFTSLARTEVALHSRGLVRWDSEGTQSCHHLGTSKLEPRSSMLGLVTLPGNHCSAQSKLFVPALGPLPNLSFFICEVGVKILDQAS